MANSANVKNLELARDKLSANNIENGLPGRESHSEEIENFLFQRLKIRSTTEAKRAKVESGQVANIKGRHMNKTMFVCGVPGTGKTATVLSVLQKMEKIRDQKGTPIHQFIHVYINGQHLSTPEKVYSEILYKLSNEQCNTEKAQDKLDNIFKSDSIYKSTSKKANKVPNCFKIIVIDELDLLYNERRQSVFYSLFDWPTSADSKMILIGIANAMDLPERFMRGRIFSRLGWDKLVFESYTGLCLENILKNRLGETLLNKCFTKEAVIVATRRIGRTTGDARRILDTCQLAIDKALEKKVPIVTPEIINQVGFQNYDTQRTEYVSRCSALHLMILKSILIETTRVGEENVEAYGVSRQLYNMMKKDLYFKQKDSDGEVITRNQYQAALNDLAGVGMIYLENEKPLLMKRMFLKESSDALIDLIRTEKIKT